MKKNYVFFAFFCICIMIQAGSLRAEAGTACSNLSREGNFIFNQDTGMIAGINAESADIRKIVIPEKIRGTEVTGIGEAAFKGMKQLVKVEIPESIMTIGAYAFDSCEQLEEVSLPEQLCVIEDGTFYGCKKLKKAELPKKLKRIGGLSFYGCKSLGKLKIPDTVSFIGEYAFASCTGIREMQIPESVMKIEKGAFSRNGNLMKIMVSDKNESYDSDDGVLFSKDHKILECFPAGRKGTYQIPKGVKKIGASAFSGCEKICKIKMPGSVISVDEGAFSDCKELKEPGLSKNIFHIGKRAFSGCEKIGEIIIPERITGIGEETFSGCSSLAAVKIPDGVTMIGYRAFSGCGTLLGIRIPSTTGYIGNNAFSGCGDLLSVTYGGSSAQWDRAVSDRDISLKSYTKIVRQQNFNPTVSAGISMNRNIKTLYTKGKKRKYILKLEYGNRRINPSMVQWSSGHPSIARVSSNGTVTGRKEGQTMITAVYRGQVYHCRITVRNPVLIPECTKITLKQGEKFKIGYKADPDIRASFKSLDRDIATVTKEGIVEAVGKGKAKIRIICDKITKYIMVKVK